MIILNELNYAKYIYENKILDDKPSYTISLLCKYFIQVLKLSNVSPPTFKIILVIRDLTKPSM